MSNRRQVSLPEVVARVTTKKALGDLCPVIGSGPSWAAKDESSVPSEGALPVLKITNTRPDGSIDLSELAYVSGLPARTKVIGATSLVMIRTNGNRERIGNVYLPSEEVHGAAVSAFQFILDALDAETRDYLYLVLRSPGIQHLMSESASGSTGLGNLAVRWLKTLEIPWPDAPERKSQVAVIGAVDDQITALDTETEALASMLRCRRSDIMTDDSVSAVRAENAFDFSTGVRRTPDRATGPYMTPYLRSANVGYGTLDLSDVLKMNYEPAERKKFGLKYGDVIVSEGSASANAVGMPAMWRDELPAPVCTQMTLLRLRALDGVCIPEFVFHWCMWAYESRAFLDVAGGTSIKHISAVRAKGMAVRLPSLDRQREIALELDAMTSVLEATRAEAVRLRAVRASLLSSLLDRTITIKPAELEA